MSLQRRAEPLVDRAGPDKDASRPGARQRIALPIGGRSCCAAGGRVVERALARVPGVVQSEANAAAGRVLIDYDPSRCDLAALRSAIARSGYGPPSSGVTAPPPASDTVSRGWATARRVAVAAVLLLALLGLALVRLVL